MKRRDFIGMLTSLTSAGAAMAYATHDDRKGQELLCRMHRRNVVTGLEGVPGRWFPCPAAWDEERRREYRMWAPLTESEDYRYEFSWSGPFPQRFK